MLLTGCSSGGTTSAGPTPTAPAASTPVAGSTASTGDAPATTSADTAGNATSASTRRCHTGDLKVTAATDETSGTKAGTIDEPLVFTNVGERPCTIYGYPGVSYVAGDQGTQINEAFARVHSISEKTVSLKPGAAAHAMIGIPNYQNLSPADGKPPDVRGFRVYPPDETAAVFVSQPLKVCSAEGQGMIGQVFPIAAGGHSGPID